MKMTNLRNLLKSYGSRNIIGMYGIRDHGQFRGPRWTHDHSAACYSSSGKLDWYFELERLTDTKHDNKLEKHWRKTPLSILEESNDFLVGSVSSFAGSSFVARDGRLRIDCGLFSDNLTSPIIPARGSVSTDPLQTFPAWGIAQELAHPFAGVAFTGIPSLPALLVHADGGATVSSFSAFLWTENEIRCIESDWETVYQAMNFGFNDLYHEIFGQNDNERLATAGRLMGLASFAKDVDIEMINWLDENNWFRNHWVNPNKFFLSAKKMYGWQGKLQNWEDPFIQQLAGCAQYELQRKILFRLRRLAKKTGVRTLYAGGGIFLNVHLNRAIEREKLFDIFIVPPNTSDSGLGLGAACLLMWLRDNFIQPITPFIQFDTTNNKSLVVIPEIIEEVVDRIIQGQAFAIVSGAAEAGPRALGHRSIICLPTTEVANRISTEIKRREWYRPVAPVGLTNHLRDIFIGDLSSPLSHWMLTTRESKKINPMWSGAIHVDKTARIQTIDECDPEQIILTAILNRLWEKVKIPCLINTSLNEKGKPIVNSFYKAKNIALKLGLDGILINGSLITWSPKTKRYIGAINN